MSFHTDVRPSLRNNTFAVNQISRAHNPHVFATVVFLLLPNAITSQILPLSSLIKVKGRSYLILKLLWRLTLSLETPITTVLAFSKSPMASRKIFRLCRIAGCHIFWIKIQHNIFTLVIIEDTVPPPSVTTLNAALCFPVLSMPYNPLNLRASH